MEMDKMGVVTTFIHNIVVYNIPLLYGTAGEIMVEKSGSLNLGVEGIMAVGAIFGYIVGCYANSLGVGILMAFLMGALCGLLFAALTVSLQANQNITGLTLTTFGLGVYFFVGNGVKTISWPVMNDYATSKTALPTCPFPACPRSRCWVRDCLTTTFWSIWAWLSPGDVVVSQPHQPRPAAASGGREPRRCRLGGRQCKAV